ncbi:MAG TPA: SCO family protein [Candidatus Binatia bacterium]
MIRQPWAWALLVFLFVGVGSMALWTRHAGRPGQGGGEKRPLEGLKAFGKVPEFALTERSGKKIQSGDLLGKVWIADFIYTHCTDTCPIQSAEMKALQDKFAGDDLRLVSITVDPERDTPAALAEYAARFGADPARWLFLTGEKQAIFRLAEQGFHLATAEIPAPERDASGATHRHSPRFVIVDRRGQIRGYYPGTEKEALDRLRRDVEAVLREKS